MSRHIWPTSGAIAGISAAVLLALSFIAPPAPAAARWDAAVLLVADSGTDEPSDSGTQGAQEDEPAPGGDEPSNANPPPEEPGGDGFGCPVRDRGPFPMLV